MATATAMNSNWEDVYRFIIVLNTHAVDKMSRGEYTAAISILQEAMNVVQELVVLTSKDFVDEAFKTYDLIQKEKEAAEESKKASLVDDQAQEAERKPPARASKRKSQNKGSPRSKKSKK